MDKMRCLVFVSLVLLISEVQPSRILGVFPIPSRSHHVVFGRYTEELAKRGHELVIITPEPQRNAKAHNVIEIDVSFAYKKLLQMVKDSTEVRKRGVMSNIDTVIEQNFYLQLLELVVEEMHSPQVQNLLNDKSQKFDLIVFEGFYEYPLIVSEIFEAPVIFFASFIGFPAHYEMMGAIGRHPILFPCFYRMDYGNLSFWKMLKELYYEYEIYARFKDIERAQDKMLKDNFGPEAPTTKKLKEKVDLLFLNSYAIFANNRPVPPNVIYLGATHLRPAKSIPEDLKQYLDNSKRGVIYVSFGSNIRPSMMEKPLLDGLLEAFETLPYNILFRYDGESLENVSENVKWHNWFPQRDLLFHPNIKAFVTQCGLQSTDEAIDAEVPLVGVPMMAEQWYNAQKYVDLGIGVKLDSLTLTAGDLVEGVIAVIGNNSYRENVRRLKALYNDQPQTPIEKAIWWTEYVIRHGGVRHLRSPMADVSWGEFYMLNIVLPVIGATILVLVLCLYIAFRLYTMVKRGYVTDNKIKRN